MRLLDILRYAFNALARRQLRSWLTILGIVVGITAIVLLIGLVSGLRADISRQLASFGSNTIMVIPVNVDSESGLAGASSFMPTSGKLFMKDMERLKKIADINVITPVIMKRTYVEYKGKAITTNVVGVEPEVYLQTSGTIGVKKGRFLTSADRRSVVLGADLANNSFDKPVEVSSELLIMGQKYRVVGILNKSGNSFANIDSILLVPFDEAQEMAKDGMAEREISSIRITVRDGANPNEVAARVTDELLSAHRVTEDKKDFGVITSEFINKQLDAVTSVLALFLGGIAGIALLVGGVGIANTMFMSVTERKREIGTLKAIGARERDIQALFLMESSLIGAAGGVIGLFAAWMLGWLITIFSGINIIIAPTVVAGAVIFSGAVGIISGFIPAKQAARLDPVAALAG